jgi:hypothetical protein
LKKLEEPRCAQDDQVLYAKVSQSSNNPGRIFWKCPNGCEKAHPDFWVARKDISRLARQALIDLAKAKSVKVTDRTPNKCLVDRIQATYPKM